MKAEWFQVSEVFSEELPWKQRNGEQLFGLPGCLRDEVLLTTRLYKGCSVLSICRNTGSPKPITFDGMELQMLLF